MGMYFLDMGRDGTVQVNFHDGTGRYIYIFTTERDGTVHIVVHDGTGRDGTYSLFRRYGTLCIIYNIYVFVMFHISLVIS